MEAGVNKPLPGRRGDGDGVGHGRGRHSDGVDGTPKVVNLETTDGNQRTVEKLAP